MSGYSKAPVHHNASRARSFLSPRSIWRNCNQFLGHKARYLRCLLDDTPLPLHYEIGAVDHEVAGSKTAAAVVSYYFHPLGHPQSWRYQPFYLTVRPGPHGMRIVGGGIPRG